MSTDVSKDTERKDSNDAEWNDVGERKERGEDVLARVLHGRQLTFLRYTAQHDT